jgi:long-chain acyl-CoA synthetase
METFNSFNAYIQRSIIDNWDQDALTDYQGITLQYHDVARKIEKLHILFENSNVKPGDKIALCGRNSAHWAVAFLATLTYGAVAVPIQHEFNGEQIHNIVNHSDSKLLFIGDYAVKTIDPEQMPALEGIINIPDFSLMISRKEALTYAREHLNLMFGSKYPMAFRKEHISYYTDEADELALINYTSGTTGYSKGVMIPYRALWSNVEFIIQQLRGKVKAGDNMLSILPMAHTYGMAFEFLFGFCRGCHLYFLTRLPSPAIIAEAFADVHPAVIITVPLVLDKIIRKRIFPKIESVPMKLLLNMLVVNKKVKEYICGEVRKVLGGNLYEVIVGGAPLSMEIERFLVNIGFPVTVGYGTTECAPLITFSDYKEFKPRSCGTPVDRMEVRIDSRNPQFEAGEILTRGTNLMLGYYKNEEATRKVIDKDGWYHTGDLGTMDSSKHVFIRGRLKHMLLGSNGQNIYPEEIEDKLNSMAMVSECIVVQRDEKLVALVHPDKDDMMNFSTAELQNIMEQNRESLNKQLPTYSRITAIELHEEEFAKTPKKSIKRYLYN